MPTLNWIGKEAVINHHKEVPFRLLNCDPTRSVGEPNGNLLIEGDNLEALKALLPYYAGQVKCIYIDPPYNTGNENWVYNDNVNSPQIRAWLGKVVGGEGEDLSRHDKWLCMMYPRLKLLWELLSNQGSLWMSIDDNEVAHLRCVMDEIFGRQNFVANVVWQKRTSPDARLELGAGHDHILVFARDATKIKLNKLPLSEKQRKQFKNPDNDPRGSWVSSDYSAQGYRPHQMYTITTPAGVKHSPPPGMCWKNVEEVFLALVADNRIWFGKDGKGVPRRKTFLYEHEGVSSWTWWDNSEVGHTQEAKKEINRFFGAENAFDTPKPTRLIQRILQIATNPGDIVLDSFAGSGTTGHAVLQLNREDSGDRRFILVELERDIARTVTAERLRRVIQGYTWTDQRGNEHHEEGLGSGLRYCTLGATIFNPDGSINPTVTWEDLARHIWFTETRNPWPGLPLPSEGEGAGVRVETCLGTLNGVAYYLYFNGIGGNVFGPSQLAELPLNEMPKVVYADTAAVEPAELDEHRVTFKQIPYDVKVY